MFQKYVFAPCIYHFVIKKRNTPGAFLVGFGLIPLSAAISFGLIEALHIENKILRLSLSILPTMGVFRVLEALYNTSPPVVETSARHYAIYWSSLHHLIWEKDGRCRRIGSSELVRNTLDVLLTFSFLSLALSVLLHYNFQPFPSPVNLSSLTLTWEQFSLAHLMNSYALVVVIFFALKFLFETDAWRVQLGDLRATKPVFLNPLWASSGTRDFWSRRWNLMIHRVLKHGVYQVTGGSIVLTFLASGLLHEFSWLLMGVGIPGKLTAFFLWNGALVGLEPLLVPLFLFLKKIGCPLFIRSTVVVTLALPVAHWYTGDWALEGVFNDMKVGLWILRW